MAKTREQRNLVLTIPIEIEWQTLSQTPDYRWSAECEALGCKAQAKTEKTTESALLYFIGKSIHETLRKRYPNDNDDYFWGNKPISLQLQSVGDD